MNIQSIKVVETIKDVKQVLERSETNKNFQKQHFFIDDWRQARWLCHFLALAYQNRCCYRAGKANHVGKSTQASSDL